MKKTGDLLACLRLTLHHTEFGTVGIIQVTGIGGEYRVELIKSNISAAQLQLVEVRNAALTLCRNELIRILDFVNRHLEAACAYLGDSFPMSPVCKILYARTEISLASSNFQQLLTLVQLPEDASIHAALTSEVVQFGHDF